eukprot:CAMPEP_0197691276 /NCGR_PEP_ID=MMETSP1338-20131121/109493_1 /TAXON_ID=43686 ORGANISM="Pelagodinium beii, Strain RCC1491" /NCGR_SAMPLE_ID=MMETSP1338 /ASSEMBLY_ACC=CAM_ASM_000754 /LENGTH=63 /DNA_ID=CAMNT_0043273805 /DNA_START=54 /DNA_END=241 /DNA_ORIENTATION=+
MATQRLQAAFPATGNVRKVTAPSKRANEAKRRMTSGASDRPQRSVATTMQLNGTLKSVIVAPR